MKGYRAILMSALLVPAFAFAQSGDSESGTTNSLRGGQPTGQTSPPGGQAGQGSGSGSGQESTQGGTSGASNAQGGTPNAASPQGGDMFVTSPPSGAVLTGDLRESTVTNRQGEEIGKVEELLITLDGRVSGLVVSVGGFLGIAQKNVAIAWNQIVLERTEQGEGYIVRVNVDRDSLEDAPEFDGGNEAGLGS